MRPTAVRTLEFPARALLASVFALLAAACGSWPETRVENRWAQPALFPIQVAPDIATTTVGCFVGPFIRIARDEDPGNLCGIAVPFAPIIGLGFGVAYAAHGVPFWVIGEKFGSDDAGARDIEEQRDHEHASDADSPRVSSARD